MLDQRGPSVQFASDQCASDSLEFTDSPEKNFAWVLRVPN